MSKVNKTTNVFVTIQNDLFACKDIRDLRKKYVAYEEALKKLYLNALKKYQE